MHFRLRTTRQIVVDLEEEIVIDKNNQSEYKIRESKIADAKFSIARNGEYFSAVSIWSNDGRGSKERKINLTLAQGKFLYYLPFPDAKPLGIDEIMNKGEIEQLHKSEIIDIVDELHQMNVIEKTTL